VTWGIPVTSDSGTDEPNAQTHKHELPRGAEDRSGAEEQHHTQTHRIHADYATAHDHRQRTSHERQSEAAPSPRSRSPPTCTTSHLPLSAELILCTTLLHGPLRQ
jgi:hypothetical protein